jgi:hypothetical protein
VEWGRQPSSAGSRPPTLPPILTGLGGIGPEDNRRNFDQELLRLLQGNPDFSPEIHEALKVVLVRKREMLLEQIDLEERIAGKGKQDTRLYEAYHDALLLVDQLLAKL